MQKHSEYLDSLREKIVEAGFLAEGYIDFYTSLFQFQEEHAVKYNGMDIDHEFLTSQDLPVIDIDTFAIDSAVKGELINNLDGLADIVQSYQPGFQADAMIDWFKLDNDNIDRVALFLLRQDLDSLRQVSSEVKTGLEEFIFLFINWIKPYFITLHSLWDGEISDTDWESPVCPFCGYFSDISKIIETRDNARMLHCALCEHEWQYKRISCAVCGNEDAEKMGYYTYGDDDIYRIDYCDTCKGYIKTVRIPKKFEENRFNLTVENIITNYLDASAIEMGYNRP